MDDDFKMLSTSTKRKRNKETRLSVVSNTPVMLDNRCPICQWPLVRGNEGNKIAHIDVCQGARAEAEECSAGVNCLSKEHQHFYNFSHYNLALSRSHEESIAIKKDKSCFDPKKKVFGHERHQKRKRHSENLTRKCFVNPTDNLPFYMTGQIIYTEEVITSKKMTVNCGALEKICEICNKKEKNNSNINPYVNFKFLSETGTIISAMKEHPIELNVTFNNKGWKTININYMSGFQVKEFKLILGNCCHFVEVKCVIGKDVFQQISELCSQPVAFFDFDSLHLNRCASPVTSIEKKLWPKIDRNKSEQRKKYPINQTTLNEVSFDYRNSNLSDKEFVDTSSCASSENLQFIQNDAKEKWKNLFKKKSKIDIPVGKVNCPLSGKMKMASKSCPFYKRIPGTSFAVDAFLHGIIPGVTHYFLTHFHSDHYCGLSKKFQQVIVCSSITAALVTKKLGVENQYVYVVYPMETTLIGNVKITPLNANHCPGSLMFLFELVDGHSYLHVGDFRADSEMEQYPALIDANVDLLFLDTTYCNPKYEFPTQEEVVKGVIEIAKRSIEMESKTLFVCGTYTIGKEKIFIGLANALQCKIWATDSKLEVLRCFNDDDLNSKLVEDPSKAQIHLWSMGNLNYEELEQHLFHLRKVFKHVVAFNPSGWNCRKGYTKMENGIRRRNVTMFGIPYSEHSNYNELRRFVKFLKPKKIVPTVTTRGENYSAISKCCNRWLIESEEVKLSDRQKKLTSFFIKP